MVYRIRTPNGRGAPSKMDVNNFRRFYRAIVRLDDDKSSTMPARMVAACTRLTHPAPASMC